MKFDCNIIIDKPRDQVVQLFADPQYLKEYQKGFERKDHVSGEPGQTGAVAKMYYKTGKRTMELTETILENSLPEKFVGSYHHKHMDNTMTCYFTSIGKNQTKYVSEIEYIAFRGFIPKVMAKLFPGLFKKQVQKWLDNFKAFAENQP